MTKRRVPAVAAAIEILRVIKEHAEGLGVTHIARTSALSKSSVHGIIKTLEAEGFLVEVGDTRRYRIGAALIDLADAVRNQRPSLAIARSHLEALARELKLACFIAAPYSNTEFLIVEKSESSRAIRVTVSVGERFPLTAGALGKAYLAWQSPTRAREIIERMTLPVRTRTSIRHVAHYLEELGRVRAQGFAECHGEYDSGTHAIAAPVFDAAGDVTLLLLTVGFPSDLPDHVMRRHGERLREAAEQVTNALGGDAGRLAVGRHRREPSRLWPARRVLGQNGAGHTRH